MPAGLPLDFDALLARIPGENPAGSSSVYFEIRPRLEEFREEVTRETREHEEQELKSADWSGVEKLTREALTARAKDIRIAGYLVEALVKRYRFDGLAAGLALIRRMFIDCWDYMFPAVEDGDVSTRAIQVDNMLDAPDGVRKGLRMPTAVRSVPLIRTTGKDAVALSLMDWSIANGNDPLQKKERDELRAAFDQAMPKVDPKALTEDVAALDRCIAVLDALAKTLAERLADKAPTLQRLRSAVEDCRRWAMQVLKKSAPMSPDGEEKTDTLASATETAATVVDRAAPRGASREALYQQLDRLAQELQRLEPHSPIPYLIRRAVSLGAMPFPQLLRALVRDANVLGELAREFALPEETQ